MIMGLMGMARVGGATGWKRTLGKGFKEFHSVENLLFLLGSRGCFSRLFTATTRKDKSELTWASGLWMDVNLF